MRDSLRFMSHLYDMVYSIRGVLLMLLLMVMLPIIPISYLEKWPIGESAYFVLVTGLTIGYGDITPETPWGRFLSIFAGFVGLLITGIVIAVATHALAQSSKERMELEQVIE